MVRAGRVLALSLLVAWASIVLSPQRADAQAPAVVINEFLASNNSGLADTAGDFSDWIELHNTSEAEIDLTGWTLTADDEVHTFVNTTIGADDYLVLFASGDPDQSSIDELHVDFRLGNTDSLVLADSNGVISNPSWPDLYPEQYDDISYGLGDGGDLFFFLQPSPGAANSGGLSGEAAPVTFSVDHGFFTTPQTVVLSTTTDGATIYYTIDGSTPNAANGTAITSGSEVTISDTTVLRAVAAGSDLFTSAVETRSYLFANDVVQQPTTPPEGWPADGEVNDITAVYGFDPDIDPTAAQTALTEIPSISVTTDLDNLFDPITGIWSNPLERGPEWERPASIELIDPTGAEPGFELNGGLRIKGGGSRAITNFKHGMRLVFNNDYGDGELAYPLHGDVGQTIYESVDLKSAQSFSWNRTLAPNRGRGEDATWIRDVWNRDTLGAMGQLNTESKYVHVYLNGQYWGLYYLEERAANQFAAQYTGGDEADFDVLRTDTTDPNKPIKARDGSIDDFVSLWPLVEDLSLTDPEWDLFQDEVDVINMTDYFLLTWFAGDSDSTPRFTLDVSNNWLAVRNRERVGDASKWIFVDIDSEASLCTNTDDLRLPDWNPTPPWNLEASVTGNIDPALHLTPAWLIEAALSRPEFVQIFQDRVQLHMLTPGGALTVSESLARLEPLIQTVNLAIDAEAARWGDTHVEPGFDRSDWEPAVQRVRDCFQLRTTVIEDYLREDGLWPESNPPPQVCQGLEVTIDMNLNGGNGDGTPDADVILGTPGDDIINGFDGDDTICGGNGADTINGGNGNDLISGQGDNDLLFGNDGEDRINGGNGDDEIHGGNGDDDLRGQGGNDVMFGDDGIDQFFGGSGNDTIETGTGGNLGTAQVVRGGGNNDTITGSPDADQLEGGAGLDIINGGGGDDIIRGGLGFDTINGGDGDDTINGEGGRDVIQGGSGDDIINGGTGNDDLFGDAGDDTLNGQGDTDTCDGGADTDTASASCETIVGVP